jgi:haloalkane dehalogenase
MERRRTPEDRFADLPGFDYEPKVVEVADPDGGEPLQMAYVEAGPADADPVLLVHGEPTWGFLYRKMIPIIAAAGHRVVVPDLIGFGRSDKPVAMTDYTYARHVAWLRELVVDRLELEDITLFGQDWGGLIGLRVLASAPERFARVVLSNTGLPTGHGRPSEAFLAWQKFSQTATEFPIGRIVDGGCLSDLAPEEIAAYEAPFPDDTFTAGARIFPSLVPTGTDDPASADNIAAWEVLSTFDRPLLLAFSDADPVTAGGDAPFLAKVPGASGQPHQTIEGAAHFVQEDQGERLAEVIVDFISTTA